MSAVLSPSTNVFSDSLILRAKNLRFRGIGNPFAFLNEIGIVPIKEFIYRGATIIDLAETLNLSITTLRIWIEENNYQGELEDASTLSAEGYIRQGELMLKTATNKFELDKAKAMIEHGRFMASKKDKKTYGNTQGELGGPAAISYIFQVGESANIQVNTHQADPKSINSPTNSSQDTPVVFSVDQTNPFIPDRPPDYVRKTHSDIPVIAPVEEPKDSTAIESIDLDEVAGE